MSFFLSSDTVGLSAMFCAAVTTINKCKTEGVIDVFQVLKSQRIQKPGSVQTIVSNRLQIIAFMIIYYFILPSNNIKRFFRSYWPTWIHFRHTLTLLHN